MLLIQLTGLSGAGKSTIAFQTKQSLQKMNLKAEVIDGDEYRKHLCKDLGFSKEDRIENIRRLGFVGSVLARNGIITIISAINPFEEARKELSAMGPYVKTVFVNCDLDTLVKRDTKGLYQRAFLPEGHAEKLHNLTGVSDPFEPPAAPDLVIHTNQESIEESVEKLIMFVIHEVNQQAAESPIYFENSENPVNGHHTSFKWAGIKV